MGDSFISSKPVGNSASRKVSLLHLGAAVQIRSLSYRPVGHVFSRTALIAHVYLAVSFRARSPVWPATGHILRSSREDSHVVISCRKARSKPGGSAGLSFGPLLAASL